MKLKSKLHLPPIQCGVWPAEYRRRQHADVVTEIAVIQNVKRIDPEIGVNDAVASMKRQPSAEMDVNRDLPWSFSGIP